MKNLKKTTSIPGLKKVSHKGKLTSSTFISRDYSVLRATINFQENRIGYIPNGYEHRPDLVSKIFYGTPDLWWLILEASTMEDPFERLDVGDRVKLPRL